jgi:uncharacterized protein (DUF1330 family)
MRSFLSGLAGMALGAVGVWVFGTNSSATEAPDGKPQAQGSPAYLVVLGDVYDREAFIGEYVAKLGPIYEQHGGEYLAVGRNWELMEGEGEFQSFVISKWPSMDAGRAFWNSDEYAQLKDARIQNNWGAFDVYLLEGLPAPASSSPARE